MKQFAFFLNKYVSALYDEVIKLVGLILAAGKSSRMNNNKLLMEIDGKPILMHTIQTMQKVVDEIVIVTGHFKEEVEQLVSPYKNIKTVHNKTYEKGMFSSILTGIQDILDDVYIIPGDIAFVSSKTFELLRQANAVIAVPIYNKHKGHPIFIKKELLNELREWPKESHLKAFRDAHDVAYIQTNDRYILVDIDTLSDFSQVKQSIERAD